MWERRKVQTKETEPCLQKTHLCSCSSNSGMNQFAFQIKELMLFYVYIFFSLSPPCCGFNASLVFLVVARVLLFSCYGVLSGSQHISIHLLNVFQEWLSECCFKVAKIPRGVVNVLLGHCWCILSSVSLGPLLCGCQYVLNDNQSTTANKQCAAFAGVIALYCRIQGDLSGCQGKN